MTRAPWLEDHDAFEGVGAHELNPRYAHVDGFGWDQALADHIESLSTDQLPALAQARRILSLSAVPIRLDGPDVSHHNYDAGPLDWDQVAAAPCTFGASKLTQSTGYLDPTGAHSRAEMARVKLRHRGLYHWLSSTTDVIGQALWFLKNLGPLLPGEYTMLDAEEAGITQAKCLQWCLIVEAHTKRPVVIYTGAYVAGGTIWQNTELRHSVYGVRPFILAAYTTEAKAKALPGVKAYPWQAWQFSSNGPVPGVTGRCDMNRRDDTDAFDLAAGVTLSPVPTTEDDMKIRLLTPNDNPAQFLAECTDNAAALRCEWTGDGGDPAVVARVAFFHDAFTPPVTDPSQTFEMKCTVADLIHISLNGTCPDVIAPEAFANAAEIRARQTTSTVDQQARDGVAALNTSVASLGQEMADTKRHLREAGA